MRQFLMPMGNFLDIMFYLGELEARVVEYLYSTCTVKSFDEWINPKAGFTLKEISDVYKYDFDVFIKNDDWFKDYKVKPLIGRYNLDDVIGHLKANGFKRITKNEVKTLIGKLHREFNTGFKATYEGDRAFIGMQRHPNDACRDNWLGVSMYGVAGWAEGKTCEYAWSRRNQGLPEWDWMYVIQEGDTGYYKIGRSNTEKGVTGRLNTLQVGNPRELTIYKKWTTPICWKMEKRMHYLLAENKERGEWFQLSAEELNKLCSIM